jgi:hypothetical protein
MVQWDVIGEAFSGFVTEAEESAASKEAKRRGLKGIGYGRYVDPAKPKEVVAKTVQGRLVLTPQGTKHPSAKKGAAEKPATTLPKKAPQEKPTPQKKSAVAGRRIKNRVTFGGDADIKNKVIEVGFKTGLAAPGNPSSALNEIMAGEVMHLVRANPKLAEDPKALAALLEKQYGSSELFKQNANDLKGKLVSTAKAGIAEAQRVNTALEHLGWEGAKVNHYYGARESLAVMTTAIERALKVIDPSGHEVPRDVAAKLIKDSGGGGNPSDTAIFAEKEGKIMMMFTSNKLATSDTQANSTLNNEYETGVKIVQSLGKAKHFTPQQVQQGEKLIQNASVRIAKITQALATNITSQIAQAVVKSSKAQALFLQNISKLSPKDQGRFRLIKKKLKIDDNKLAVREFFKKMAAGQPPTSDEAKLMTRGLAKVSGIPSAAQISAKSRGEVVDVLSKTRKSLDRIQGKGGMKMGTTMEAVNLVNRLHIDAAFEESKHGVNAFEGLFEVNMGGTRVNQKVLQHCLGVKNEKDFLRGFNISNPIPMKDTEGNVTGASAELFSVDAQGQRHKIATRQVRSKQGITGKLETSYKWATEMQHCFKGEQ